MKKLLILALLTSAAGKIFSGDFPPTSECKSLWTNGPLVCPPTPGCKPVTSPPPAIGRMAGASPTAPQYCYMQCGDYVSTNQLLAC